MTVPIATYPYGLGGAHGGNRKPDPKASSGAVETSNSSNEGARSITSAIARGAIEDAGIRAGEIIAHRIWKIRDGILTSVIMDYVEWHPGEPIHSPEISSFGLGTYAFKRSGLAEREYGCFASFGAMMAIGTVALWGNVIEHTNGYRGEYAAVNSIDKIIGVPLLRKIQFWRPSVLEEFRTLYAARAHGE